MQITLARLDVDLHLLQGLNEAGQHRQRRTQFVRDIGDKIAPHAVKTIGLRDVRHLQQPAILGIGHELDREHALKVALQAKHQSPREVALTQVVNEARMAHQIDDCGTAIGLRPQAELTLGGLVAELDAKAPIEQNDTVVHRMYGGDQTGKITLALSDLLEQFLFMAIQSAENAVPLTIAFKAGIEHRLARPTFESRKVTVMHPQMHAQANVEKHPAHPGFGEVA